LVLPDPGEYQRALTGEDEGMLSLPRDRMEARRPGLKQNEQGQFAYRNHQPFRMPDFPQPEFCRQLFKDRGLDAR
jgi:hypothetical protein